MNDLVLDPSETREPRSAAPARGPAPAKAGLGRVALVSALGLAGLGAFAGATSLMSGLVSPKPASAVAIRHKAADWPDLKDGLPALAGVPAAGSTGTAAARISLPPAEPPVAEAAQRAAAEPPPVRAADAKPLDTPLDLRASDPKVPAPPAPLQPVEPVRAAARPAPPIENAPVIGPARQASVLPPPRPVSVLPARTAETVRARTASTTFAALPPEPAAKPEIAKPESAKSETAKPEATRAVPAAPLTEQAPPPAAAKAAGRGEEPKAKAEARKAKPVQARKPAAATAVAAAAVPEEPEETEVFGIRVPTLAATGRKIGAGVEALGDAVKSLPDKF